VEIYVHLFLNSGLHKGEWPASRPFRLSRAESATVAERVGG